MVFGLWLPHSPLGPSLGLTHLPQMYWAILMLTLLGYVSLTQVIKFRKNAQIILVVRHEVLGTDVAT